jgi:hypothetical protein
MVSRGLELWFSSPILRAHPDDALTAQRAALFLKASSQSTLIKSVLLSRSRRAPPQPAPSVTEALVRRTDNDDDAGHEGYCGSASLSARPAQPSGARYGDALRKHVGPGCALQCASNFGSLFAFGARYRFIDSTWDLREQASRPLERHGSRRDILFTNAGRRQNPCFHPAPVGPAVPKRHRRAQ